MNTTFWLMATLAFTSALWMPYVLHRMVRLGLARTLGNPAPQDAGEHAPWAQRARAADANAVANLAHFGVVALAAVHFGAAGDGTATAAAATYFFARVVHYLAYTAGVFGLRTVAFLVGFGAEATLLVVAARAGGVL